MGWILDLLKELPLSAILEDKIKKLESDHAKLQAENAGLKSELEHTKIELAQTNEVTKRLTDRINKSQESGHLDENEEKILLALSGLREKERVDAEAICAHLNINMPRTRFYLNKLENEHLISAAHFYTGTPTSYALAPPGNEYLVKHNLV